MKSILLLLCALFGSALQLYSQSTTSDNILIFSSIKGKVSKPGTVIIPFKKGSPVASVKLSGPDKENFKILSSITSSGKSGNVVLEYAPSASFVGIQNAILELNNPAGKTVRSIALTGLSTNGLEGENEAPLSRVIEALGYKIDPGWTKLANNCLPALQGDEIASALFRKAGAGKVEMIPVARYSPDFELPFGYYTNTKQSPVKHQAGVLAKSGKYTEHQVLFPSIASGSPSFDPGTAAFGFYATGPTHSGYSEDVWNMALHPTDAVHATRIYPVKDKTGKLMPNTYLVCFEEAKNGDYNDYMFLAKNIVPVKDERFTTLFNGKDLSGWHTYLRNIGVNADPNKNFRIEDGMLHVIGKDLGYAITDKSYSNYHFKVDFKWGEKKWPPRENNKRDAGICYNIPPSEPDSIWPQSIECQIQEGDTGDFWLLSRATIEVNGKRNVPANHTQIVKKKDNEKPTGEWNTVEVVSYNGRCVHIVNGVIVNAGENASTKSGRILLQSEFSEIFYKNVKIREL
ncbi:MAG: DUF1080 domain-containing protein [Sphingobacteriaceae bacterium]|nr:DUF1080 domain-containing protein [Sphingobacteriaceae bacterium]